METPVVQGTPAAPQANTPQATTATVASAELKQTEGAPKAEPGQEPAKRTPLSSEFSALSKQRKQIQREREAFQREREAFLAQKAEFEPKVASWESAKDPIAALQAKGWSYKDATEFVLNNQKPTPEMQVKSVEEKMDAWMKSQEEAKTKAEADAKAKAEAEYQATVDNFKKQVNEFVSSNTEQYELINLHEAQDLVFSTIEEHFNSTQKVLSNKEAADLVERYLEEKIEASTKTKKFASKFAPQPDSDGKPGTSKEARTLTNSLTTSVSSSVPARTEEERIRRALAAMEK